MCEEKSSRNFIDNIEKVFILKRKAVRNSSMLLKLKLSKYNMR